MKDTMKCLGVIAIVAVIGFSFAACEEPSLDDTPALNSITAEYAPTTAVFPDTEIDDLKADLTVTAYYDDGGEKQLDAKDYRLSGTLTVGTSDITVTYYDKTTDFTVTVTAEPHNDITYTAMQAGGIDEIITTTGIVFTFGASVDSFDLTAGDITVGGAAEKGTAEFTKSGSTWRLSPITVNEAGNATVSINKPGIEAETKHVMVYKEGEAAPILIGITAVYTQGETIIYPTPTTQIDELKARLTVKAQYNNGKEFRLSAGEYTLDGTLTVGTSTVTVSYENKTAGFTVNVTPAPEYWNITWHLDGGTAGMGAYPAHIVKGEVLEKPSPNPSKAENIFIGWYSDPSFTQPYTFDNSVTTNLSLYANWLRKIDTTLREVTINMFDSAPDGWDGDAALTIVVNGEQIATGIKVHTNGAYNIPSGQTGSNTYTFLIDTGDVVELKWVAGQYQEENSFIAYYTDTPPVPVFTANNNHVWSGNNALVYKLRGTMKDISGDTPMGTFKNTTPPTITTASLPVGTVGTAYSYTLTAAGGTPTWNIESGALPANLTLSTAGVISGTPTTAGISTFTVTATNDEGSDSRYLSIIITASGVSMAEAIELTENLWTYGNLPTSSSRQWYVFTATASTQYIHAAFGTLNSTSGGIYVQLYEDNGTTTVGANSRLYSSTTNISRSLTEGETYYIMVRTYSGSYNGTYRIGFTKSTTAPILPSIAIPLPANQWADGSLQASGDEQWYVFTATASAQRIHFEPGTTNYALVLQLYDSSSGATVGSETTNYSTDSTPRSLIPGQEYYMRVRTTSSYSSAYRIGFTASIVPPGVNPIPLTENQWADGSILALTGQQWFTFTATASPQYIHADLGTLTTVAVSVYDSSEVSVNGTTVDSFSTSRSLTPGQMYYIKVTRANSSSGSTYRIAFNASIIPPGTSFIPLTENQWTDGNLPTYNDRQWFTFTATASTQYIHIEIGTLTQVYVNVYDSSEVAVGSETNLTASTPNTSRSLTPEQTYYIRVRPYSSDYGFGTYRIVFTASTTVPSVQLPPDAIPLTANQWANGSLPTSSDVQWFTFTATASTQYIHFAPGTLNSVSVQVYDSSGSAVGSETQSRSVSRSLTQGNTYYIRVRPYGSNTGAYRIGFNATFYPPGNIIQLTANQWADGDIPAPNDHQWFTFTATASTHVIHKTGALGTIYMAVFNSSGGSVGSEVTAPTIVSLSSLTQGQTYYIRIRSYNNSTGTYRIGFNSTAYPPGVNPIPLTANQWADDSLQSGDVQWFVFTATAATQYIHAAFGTLTGMYAQVYNSSGTAVGSDTALGSTKYISRSLTVEQTYYIRVRQYSTYTGNYRIGFTTSIGPPGTIRLTSGEWADGNLPTSGDVQWFAFTATAATHYIYAYFGTLTSMYVNVLDSNGGAAGGNEVTLSGSTGNTNGLTRSSLTSGQTYYIRVSPSSGNSGAYRIAFNSSTTAPTAPIQVPSAAIPLNINQWADGSLPTSTSEEWFVFTATASTQYIHTAFGTLPASNGITVQVYTSSGAARGATTRMYILTTHIPRSLTAGETYYIRVRSYNTAESGTYRIAFTATLGIDSIPLTENIWKDGNLPTSNDYQWFTFTATAATQYIHVAFGTLSASTSNGVYVNVYHSSGSEVGSEARLYSTTVRVSRTLTSGDTYYIKVRAYSSSNGTYRIGFSATSGINPIPLTINQWEDGSLSTSNDYQWFTFTANASTQLIHVEYGTLTDLYVQVYTSSGATSGSETNLSNNNTNISASLTSGQTYYIRVRPNGNSGTYRIAFNTSGIPPGINPISLTENGWADCSLSPNGQQWFTFIATASPQYIHAAFGTLPAATGVRIQVYDSSGTLVGNATYLYASATHISRSLTAGQTYYIRIMAYTAGNSGTYRIAFTATPGIDHIQLTAGQWADGDLETSNDYQWFVFTATAATQYIHVSLGTLTDLYVNVYNSSGTVQGTETRLNTTIRASRTLTSGQTYYIRVRAYDSNSGTYRIAFNASTIAPAQ